MIYIRICESCMWINVYIVEIKCDLNAEETLDRW